MTPDERTSTDAGTTDEPTFDPQGISMSEKMPYGARMAASAVYDDLGGGQFPVFDASPDDDGTPTLDVELRGRPDHTGKDVRSREDALRRVAERHGWHVEASGPVDLLATWPPDRHLTPAEERAVDKAATAAGLAGTVGLEGDRAEAAIGTALVANRRWCRHRPACPDTFEQTVAVSARAVVAYTEYSEPGAAEDGRAVADTLVRAKEAADDLDFPDPDAAALGDEA